MIFDHHRILSWSFKYWFMLILNLKPIFTARGIDKPYAFLTKNGFTHNTAKSLVAGKSPTINIRYMERLCELLWCEPNDLFLWQPAENTRIPDGHPLLPLLRTQETVLNIKHMLARVPLKKLNGLSEVLIKEIEGEKE